MANEKPAPTIVQQFLLSFDDEGDGATQESTAPNFMGDVVKPLKTAGYRVLASMDVTDGVPHNILVEGPMSVKNMDLKERAHTLFRCCGIRASSGDALIEL